MKKWIAGAAMALAAMTGSAYADGHGDYPDRPIIVGTTAARWSMTFCGVPLGTITPRKFTEALSMS